MKRSDLEITTSELLGPRLGQLKALALGMLVVGVVLNAAGFLTEMSHAQVKDAEFWHRLMELYLQAYLQAFLVWTGASAGCLSLLMIHHCTGGGWGYVMRRFWEAAARLLPLMAILFIPIALGASQQHLYEWTRPEVAAHLDEAGGKAKFFLNVPFFCIRTLLYFTIWSIVAFKLTSLAKTQEQRNDPHVFAKLNYWGALGLVVYLATTTFATVDWIMSLTPHWVSSIFGLILVVSQGLTGMAISLFLLSFLASGTPLLKKVPTNYFKDLGNMMLAFVMAWAYMSFSEYLLQYSGNLKEEVVYFIRRQHGNWGWVGLVLIVLHFALPFLTLVIGSHVKRSPEKLARVALLLILMRFVDTFWWVAPTFRDSLWVTFMDLGMPLLIGGIWLLAWSRLVAQPQPIVPLHDPRLQGAWHEMVAHHG